MLAVKGEHDVGTFVPTDFRVTQRNNSGLSVNNASNMVVTPATGDLE